MRRWQFDAIGTGWEIETEADLSDQLRNAVTAEIQRFDREWSRFRADSLVSQLATAGGSVAVPRDAAAMLDSYVALSNATDGAVNPLVGESLAALGYDADYSLTAGTPRVSPPNWQQVLVWSGDALTLTMPALIDVGALGKGRLVDRVFAVLSALPGTVIVDASGDVRVKGEVQRVALEHPYDTTKAIGVVSIQNQALCASATNRRAWGSGLHHVLDARTGRPVHTWAATWAISTDAMRADAVSTALFFEGGPQLAAEWHVEWVRMSTDGRVERSPGCTAKLFFAK